MTDAQGLAAKLGSQGRRRDPRREATRQAIIETAESLFGQQGIDAVSLRQIGAEIGAANTAVVSYHFGDKEALIDAILKHRLPAFERRRAELIASFGKDDPDIGSLLRAIWLPLFEQRNAQGKRSYAAFLANLGRSQWGWIWRGSESIVPVTLELGREVEDRLPPNARRYYWQRTLACTALLTSAIGTIDNTPDLCPAEETACFEDAIRMAAAALSAAGSYQGQGDDE